MLPRNEASTRFAALIAVATTAMLLVACAPGPPDAQSDIVGTIAQYSVIEDGISILVSDQTGTSETLYDIASVSVRSDATVLIAEGDSYALGTPEDIPNGADVEIWFEGPVAESYPVQAKAGTVVVLSP